MIKVMHIVKNLEIGGLENLVLDMSAHAISDHTLALVICSIDNIDTPLTKKAKELNVLLYKLSSDSSKSKISILKKLTYLIQLEKADILHTHNSAAHIYGALASLITKIPLVHTKHGNILPFGNLKSRWLNRFAAKITKKIIAVSNQVKQTVITGYKINPLKVTTIPNGIHTDKFRVHKTASKNSFIIGSIGRLSKEKDFPTLLKAFKDVASKIPQAKLIIIGDGPLKKFLINETNQLKIRDKVNFLGFRDDIPELLSGFDVYAQSSTTEGISLTLLEAMAMGLPIVATNVGGNPEIIIDGETGYLIDPQQPKKMAYAIVSVLSNKSSAEKMGLAGRNRVEGNFNLKIMIKRYSALYSEVLNLTNKRN